ncbi:hypothetical protein R3W88_034153 [Solanum pinnatisectum]|uniref:Uncharacterized protein n=1 Tax=Solanum pinnatisectum TaxID=50273 RepID=A0AAV9JZ07_9SOLN|nr:hypothetical protein R3W88_034153 [Solanum pinnatisectum]
MQSWRLIQPATMSMLSKGKQKIDVMIINIHPTNMISFNLLTQAMALDVISLIAKKILDKGAHLYLQKPFNVETMKYLWQLVLREKKQREKLTKESERNRDHKNVDDTDEINVVGENEEQPREKKIVANAEEQKDNIDEVENDVISNEKFKLKRKRGIKNTKETNEGKIQSSAINKVVMQKDCREWTNDLHAKFMKVVQELGEGRCYPKEILEVMIHDVPDLTRMQVASHIQKCRCNDWRAPEERKHIHQPSSQGSSNDSKKKSTFQKYGIMSQTKRGTNFPISTLNTNKSFARGESSIQQQLCPQLQFGSQCGPCSNIFRGTFGTKIRNATINMYNLNVNADKVYDTYVGSATFNELGVANTNFQQYIGEPNMSNPSSIIGASYVNYIEGSDSNKKKNCNVYFDFNNMNYLFQNHGPSSSNT